MSMVCVICAGNIPSSNIQIEIFTKTDTSKHVGDGLVPRT